MGARGLATAACVDEHHPTPAQGRGDTGGMPHPEMLHHHSDRRVLQRNFHGPEQEQGATLGERPRIEDAPEVFRRERRQHRSRETFVVGGAASNTGKLDRNAGQVWRVTSRTSCYPHRGRGTRLLSCVTAEAFVGAVLYATAASR